jgi:hypothetical protein
MRLIRELFAGDIDRKIEEVIKVDQTDEEIVAQEIKEYIITEAIERSLHDVLEAYREAPNKPNEGIAAWVSGFFGSGKSSFAKYLGLAISNRPIQGVGAADRLAQQTNSARIKALLETIKVQIPTEAIIFDVSAERSIGADQSITEIFYRQLLEHLHYSNNLQVAELQIELEEQGRFDAFLSEYEQLNFKESWEEAKTRQTQALPRASAVMHKLEPQTYPNEKSWAEISRGQQVPITTAVFADRAIQLMTRHRPGKQLLFVVDEVGQYVARDVQKMLDLQAIVQQLGVKGRGRVWVMVTSQERLQDVVGALDDNRPELARLQDRFPYKPTLEPSDIAEVTSKRVLGKNAEGEQRLSTLFNQVQGRLSSNTKLESKLPQPALTAKGFIDLYPLLPYQIELIISIVSGLRLSGGASKQYVGANRTIIKLAQELLTNPQCGLAEAEPGALVTLDRVYDLQSNFIDSQYRSKISQISQLPRKPEHQLSPVAVAKAICLLQFVDHVPTTEESLAVVLHPDVAADSLKAEVSEICRDLVERNLIRKADGQYRIPKPEEEDWEQVRSQQAPSQQDRNALLQKALALIWNPQPQASLGQGLRSFKAGLRFRGAELVKGDVPVAVVLVDPSEKAESRTDELRQNSQQERDTFFWAVQPSEELQRALGEWFRSDKVIALKSRDANSKGQVQLVNEENRKLDGFRKDTVQALERALKSGTILLNGGIQHHTPTAASAPDALNEVLRDGLASIYDRFADAPISPSADELSKLLIVDNLKGLTGAIETLELCKEQEGQWVIDPTRPAPQEVLNRIKSKGPLTGKDLRDHFGAPPFGWTVDGVKFLVGALQRANLLKATHQAQSFVGSSDPKVKTWFGNNTAFNSTAFQFHEPTLTTKEIVEASKLFSGFSGKVVQGVQVAPLAREIRDQARQLIAELNAVVVSMTPLQLPGTEELAAAVDQLSTWQDSDDEEVVKSFRGNAEAMKAERQRAKGIKAVLESRLVDLERAQKALGPLLWGVLEKEPELPEALQQARDSLADRLQSLSFYEHVPQIDQLTSQLELAYVERCTQAKATLVEVVEKQLEALSQAPGYADLEEQQQEQLKAPLLLRQEEAQALDLVRLKEQPAVVEGLARQQEALARSWAFPEATVATVLVREICKEPITEDQLPQLLERIERRCQEELGNGRKVLLQ